ncbi:autotransporter outer membrane beta-barrel domain-containing protein [Blastopirellula retiformator]|uniref:Uncharacterized protein n=1 Tax=Blastopirellula retiformator TaxID=2527970 RepID=A0A5C5UZ06_9BACT|nr:hypothetical protein [Blastopirellula retiformator]TWT30722.1 hypothetical protein Enr8_42450 [Blastopirellula retiformator]
MALFVWRGDAQGRAQVSKIVAEFVEAGDIVTLTINRKDIAFTALSDSLAPIYEGLIAAIEEADLPELADITAEVVTDDSTPYLKLTGAADGRPFTITTDASNGSLGDVAISTTTSAFAGSNEKQTVTLPAGVTGGTFTLTFDSQETGNIAYNASAATVQTALEALSNIDSGDVEVSGAAGGPWTIEFKATYVNTDVPLLLMDSSSLTAGTVSIAEIAKGQAGTNEIVRVTMTYSASKPSGTPTEYAMTFGASNHIFRWIDFSDLDTAAKFKTQMETHPDINSSNVTVTLVSSAFRERVYDVEFTGSLGGFNWDITFFEASGYGIGSGATTQQDGSATGTNERQQVTLTGSPGGGTFTLTYNGQTTGNIAYNASAAMVETALEALSNITSGDVSVSGAVGNWLIDFENNLAATDVPLMTGDGANLTGGAGAISVTQSAASPVNERQTVSLSEGVTGGTFTLTYAGQESGNISYSAAASAVETALEALSNIGAVGVTGPEGGPWIVEFQGGLAATNVALMSGDGANLTGDNSQTLTISSLTTPTGPHHWSEPENWDQNSVPVNGSDVRIENTDSSILYGLGQSAVTLDSLDVRASFTGSIGLPNYNEAGFYEYLPTHLAVGATVASIGKGEGSGSSLVRLDTSSAQTAVTVHSTGGTSSTNGYAVEWVGTNASNTMVVYKGSVGVAIDAGDVAVLDSLNVSFVDSRDSDALVALGDDVTVGDIVKNGGELTIGGKSGTAIDSIQNTAGVLRIEGTDAVSQLYVEGGEVYYWTSGTLGGDTVVDTDGQLIFDGDMRDKVVTNIIIVRGDSANVIDTNEVVQILTLRFQGTTRLSDLGNDIIVTRGADVTTLNGFRTVASTVQQQEVDVTSTLQSIGDLLDDESYTHPAGKTAADIIQFDVSHATADVDVHDASNDIDGTTTTATTGVTYWPILGAAALAMRLKTASTATCLIRIWYA